MKLIHKFKSKNFDIRKSKKIKFIIIHYTALRSISESIKYLCSKKNKVSSHYVISKNGSIFSLISEKHRAWHCGHSYWNEIIDMNSNSIGIELDYFPKSYNTKYSINLIYSLIELLKVLKTKYKINPKNILGHSDIAPYRKIDPGRNFPWHILERYNLAFKIKILKNHSDLIIKKWFYHNGFDLNKKKILFMLNYIGYDISLALVSNENFNQLINAYSNRFRLGKFSEKNKKKLFQTIELHFINIFLTKSKK